MRNALRTTLAYRSMPALALLCAVAAVAARAESVYDLLDEARRLVADGHFEEATEKFNSAYREAPDRPGIDYAAGAAYLAQAEQLRESDKEKAKSAYANARAHFEKLAGAEAADLRREAVFAIAHCRARLAELEAAPHEFLALPDEQKSAVPPDEFKKRVDQLREGAAAYDACIAQYPDDARGRQNAGRLRYLWKKMLQALPKKQYQVVILRADTDYPGAVAQPVPEQATVQLRPGAPEGSGS